MGISVNSSGRTQPVSVDDKIIFALEKISQVFKVLLWDIAKKNDLTPLQIQILLHLNSSLKGFRRVSVIADEIGITQATISDSVKVLIEKGLISKTPSRKDRRVYILKTTPRGRRLIQKNLIRWKNAFKRELNKFPVPLKETVMLFFMNLIAYLHRSEIIKITRMCFTCRFFKRNIFPESDKPHFCKLTERRISNPELSVNCQRSAPLSGCREV